MTGSGAPITKELFFIFGHPSILISCLITCYNREKFVGATIESAFAQEFEHPLEIVIIDDGSSDGSRAIIQEKVESYKGPFHVRFHRMEKNVGIAGAINMGVQLARGLWIVEMDADDVYPPTRCQHVWEIIHRHPELLIIAASSRIVRIAGSPCSYRGYDGRSYERKEDIPASRLFSSMDERCLCARKDPAEKRRLDVYGTAMSFHKKIYEVFGPLPAKNRPLQDPSLELRALLLGGAYGESRIAVDYQMHSDNLCNRTFVSVEGGKRRQLIESEKFRSASSLEVTAYQNNIADIDFCLTHGVSDFPREKLLEIKRQKLLYLNGALIRHRWWEVSLREKIARLFRYAERPRMLKWWPFIRLMPLPVFAVFKPFLDGLAQRRFGLYGLRRALLGKRKGSGNHS